MHQLQESFTATYPIVPSWRNSNELSYLAPAWDFTGGPQRPDRIVLASPDGAKRAISQSWPQKLNALENRFIVDIQTDSLSPSSLTVPAGSSVMWKNDDSLTHTVVGNDGDKGFDSKDIGAGKTFSTIFGKPGTFTYSCSLRSTVVGTIVVTATPAPAASRKVNH